MRAQNEIRSDQMGQDRSPKRVATQEHGVENGAPPFGANEMRLDGRQWGTVVLVFLILVLMVPSLWQRFERFETGPDYRIPYVLSRDYWLYSRRVQQVVGPNSIILLGDSVVWGEYVRPEGAWSAFLNQETHSTPQFINGGVNGLFPLALEGLVRHYASFPKTQKVLLHCNLLWMTSPQADLSTAKEEHFNHARLVPQFSPKIPCYRADSNERIGATLQNEIPFLAWGNHLQDAYFGQKSVPSWTLADDGGDPVQYPNTFRNPFSQISMTVPSAPLEDPLRGPTSPRHKPWSTNTTGTTRFDWVPLESSLQWAAFQRVTQLLRERGNELFVVVGPFNEHLLAADHRMAYGRIRDGATNWLGAEKISFIAPEPLPSLLYADASHPLTDGYQLLAKRTVADIGFRRWAGVR